MGILLGLLAALAYGTSDFGAGLASRRYDSGPVSAAAMAIGLVCAAIAVLIHPGDGPRSAALLWGALSGVGGGLGTLALYRGLAVGRMTVVASLSAVLTAVVPAIVGLLTGDSLSVAAATGIVIAIPAIALVSWSSGDDDAGEARLGIIYGVLAGLGFALLFIALDHAGTRSGAWPLIAGQALALVLLLPFGRDGYRRHGAPAPRDAALIGGAGILSGVASLLFLAATGHGQLAVVAVVTALYPAFTVLLARAVLAEDWSRAQAVGLGVSAAAIVLVSVG